MIAFRMGRYATAFVALVVLSLCLGDAAEAQRGGRGGSRGGGSSRGGSSRGGSRSGSFRGSSGGSRGGSIRSGISRAMSGRSSIGRSSSSGFRGSSGTTRSFRGSSGGSSSTRSFGGSNALRNLRSSSPLRNLGGSSTRSFSNRSGSSGISGRGSSGSRVLGRIGGSSSSSRTPRFSQPSSFARGSLFPRSGSSSRSGIGNRGTRTSGGLNFGTRSGVGTRSGIGSRSGSGTRSGTGIGSRSGGIRSGSRGTSLGGRSNILGSGRSGIGRSGSGRSGSVILGNRNRRSPFNSRWNNWSLGNNRFRTGYRRGLRNSWGLWLAGGYGGWGLGYGGYFGGGRFFGGGLYGGFLGGAPLGYFGYNYAAPINDYYNPYCQTSTFFPTTTTVYDYSQPIIGGSAPNDVAVDGMTLADEAFRNGDYVKALAEVDKAIQAMPKNADLHQFRALALFAMGNYRDAAAAAHAALLSGRGWNWETLRSFYPAKDVYTAQLRALESSRTASPKDVALRFLLGYHYMMLGHADAAAQQLVVVTDLEPRDQLAAELLAAISKETGKTYRPIKTAPPVPPLPETSGTQTGPQLAPRPLPPNNGAAAKLKGSWKSTQPDGTVIALVLKDGNKFQWTADNAGRKTVIEGKFSVKNDQLQFTGEKPGQVLEGTLTVKNDGEFQFRLKYLPEGEPGLTFSRQ